MMRDVFIRWISLLLFIAVSILVIKLFLWLLPILAILFLAYFISVYFSNRSQKDIEVEKVKKHSKKKNKKIVIIDEENND